MKLTKLQFASIVIGSTGVVLNTTGLVTGNSAFSFAAVFFGRASAVVYLCALDRFRWWSFIPLVFSITNIFFNSQELLFVELLSQAAIYQFVALITFEKMNKIKRE